MKYANRSVIFLLLLLTASCSKKESQVEVRAEVKSPIQESWALTEIGHSTVNGVESREIDTGGPVQGLVFYADGSLYKRGEDMKGYFDAPFYRVDSLQNGLQLQLLTSKRGDLVSSAGLRVQNHEMILYPVCEDSCYFKFGRLLPL